ncbi:MAG: hypothetical protein AMXMBFR83_05270 [Phycisphaerae bacterium]
MSIELFDTHCHLTSPELLARREEVLARAAAAGVTRCLTVACRAEEFEAALALGGGSPEVYVSAGFHPHEAARVSPSDWPLLEAAWRRERVVAAGEMGLDYHYDFSPRQKQKEVFDRQLALAADAGLPVVIHCRQAQPDVIDILLRRGFQGRAVVFHCFSGTPEEAAELRSFGWRVSFTGLITFKNAGPPRQACLQTPPDQIMFETDAPYLSPEPVRKMRINEPANVAHTLRFAADLLGTSFEELAGRATRNARAFFRV